MPAVPSWPSSKPVCRVVRPFSFIQRPRCWCAGVYNWHGTFTRIQPRADTTNLSGYGCTVSTRPEFPRPHLALGGSFNGRRPPVVDVAGKLFIWNQQHRYPVRLRWKHTGPLPDTELSDVTTLVTCCVIAHRLGAAGWFQPSPENAPARCGAGHLPNIQRTEQGGRAHTTHGLLSGEPNNRWPISLYYPTFPCTKGPPQHRWRRRCVAGERGSPLTGSRAVRSRPRITRAHGDGKPPPVHRDAPQRASLRACVHVAH